MALLVYPLEVVSTHIKTLNHTKRIPMAIRDLYRKEGLSRFTRGLSTVFFEVVPCEFIFISLYSFSSYQLSKYFDKHKISNKWMIPPVCSTLGIMGSYILLVPILTVQTRIQANKPEHQYRNLFDGLRQIRKTEGLLRLYYASYIYFAFQATFFAIQYTTYENLKKYYKQRYGKEEFGLKDSILCTFFSTFLAASFTNPIDTLVVRYQIVNFKCETKQGLNFLKILKDDFQKYGFIYGTNRGYLIRTLVSVLSYGAVIPVFEAVSGSIVNPFHHVPTTIHDTESILC